MALSVRPRRPELGVLTSRVNNGGRFSQHMVPPLELDEFSTVSFRSLSCSAPATFEVESGNNVIDVRIGALPTITSHCPVAPGTYKSYKTLAQAVANGINDGMKLVAEAHAIAPKLIGLGATCVSRVDAKGMPAGYSFGLRTTIPAAPTFAAADIIGLIASAPRAGHNSVRKEVGKHDAWDASAMASFSFTRGSGSARWAMPLAPLHHAQVALGCVRAPVPVATAADPDPYAPAVLGDQGTCLLYEEGSTYKVYYGRGLLADTGRLTHNGDVVELRREEGGYIWYVSPSGANPVFQAISNAVAIGPDAVPTRLYTSIRTPGTSVSVRQFHTDISGDPPPLVSGTDADPLSDPSAMQIDASLLGAEAKAIAKYISWNQMQRPLGFLNADLQTPATYKNSFSSDLPGAADGVSSMVVRLPSLPIRTRSYAQGAAISVPTIAIVDRPDVVAGRIVYTESSPLKLWVGGTGLQSVGELAIEIRDGGGDLLDTNGETVVQLVFE